jgi:hypothetical protein
MRVLQGGSPSNIAALNVSGGPRRAAQQDTAVSWLLIHYLALLAFSKANHRALDP